MIYGEKTRRVLHQDSKGLTGKVVMLCDWADVDPAPIVGLPHYGDSWVSVALGSIGGYAECGGIPLLRVVDIQMDEADAGKCEYTASYSTERQLTDTFCDISLEIALQPGEDGDGWTWEATGLPVVDVTPPPLPVGELSIKLRRTSTPFDITAAALNQVNDRTFCGYPEGCVLFIGANTESSYDVNGDIIAVSTTYKFCVKTREHNYFWRKGLRVRGDYASGFVPLHYSDNPADAYYTTDPTKLYTPVYASGAPGIADWDKWIKSGAYYYIECDFATVLEMAWLAE
jgi:hypothetical protein